MKVSELIEMLSKANPQADVKIMFPADYHGTRAELIEMLISTPINNSHGDVIFHNADACSTVSRQRKEVEYIIESMCEHGFMHGILGDVSKEYQQDQVDMFMALSANEKKEYMLRNRHNLMHNCGITSDQIRMACGLDGMWK